MQVLLFSPAEFHFKHKNIKKSKYIMHIYMAQYDFPYDKSTAAAVAAQLKGHSGGRMINNELKHLLR